MCVMASVLQEGRRPTRHLATCIQGPRPPVSPTHGSHANIEGCQVCCRRCHCGARLQQLWAGHGHCWLLGLRGSALWGGHAGFKSVKRIVLRRATKAEQPFMLAETDGLRVLKAQALVRGSDQAPHNSPAQQLHDVAWQLPLTLLGPVPTAAKPLPLPSSLLLLMRPAAP